MSKEDSIIARPISRRTFAKVMGAAGAVAGLGGGAAKIFVDASEAAAVTVNNSVGCCKICGTECAYIAKVTADGHFELFGQPSSPTDNIWGDGKGRMCVKGYSGPEKALNPDRMFYPMKRTNANKGPNEDPKFVKITWTEAYALAAQKLNETVAQYGGKSVAVLSRGNDWSNRFQPALGTPNKMGHQSTCFTTHTWAWPALVPQVAKGGRSWTHDYANSTYLLSFGHDQVGRAQNPTVQGVIKALENGAKATVFDPRLSIMAAKSLAYGGRYYAVKPGTDLAILWAMIKWIVANNKWDTNFISTYVNATDWTDFQTFVGSNGFSNGELGAGATVADVAAWAEAKSGVPAADILAVVQEFTNDGNYANWRPTVMTHKRDGAGGPNYDNGWRSAYALLVLEILVGSVDREGGNILDRTFSMTGLDSICLLPSSGYPPIEKDTAGAAFNRVDYRNKWTGASGGQGSFETLTTAIMNDDPYPIRYLLVSYYNFPMNSCDTARAVAAMKKCFVVQHGALNDAGAWMADVLMPDLATYENTYISESGKSQGMSKYKFIKLSEAMFPLIGDGKSQATTYEGIAAQADSGGGGVFATWQAANQAYYDAQSAAWKATNATYMTGRDSVRKFCTNQGIATGTTWSGGNVTDIRLAALAAAAPTNGWTTTITNRATFRAQRGWAGDKSGIYPKPSEAPAFVNYAMLSSVARIRLDITARGAGEYAKVANPANPKGAAITLTEKFPGWRPSFASANPAAGTFAMIVNREPMLVHTESKAEDMVVELSGGQRIEMHPDSAGALGIADGDTIKMTSGATGATGRAVVRLTKNIRKDSVLVAHGWGQWQLSAMNNAVPTGITPRKFGFNASAGVGADDNAFVMALPLQTQANRLDPSCSAVMNDVLLTVAKA